MNLLEIKKEITLFWIIDDQLYLGKKNSIIIEDYEVPIENGFDVLINYNSFFIKNYNANGFEQTTIVNKLDRDDIKVMNKIFMTIIDGNLVLFSSYDEEFNTIVGMYDIMKDLVLWERKTEDFFHLHKNSNLFFSNEDNLYAINCQSGNVIWKYDINQNSDRIERIIDVHDNQLLIGLKNSKLLSLDLNTGEVLWYIKEGVPVDNLRLSERDGKLYALQLNIYVVIDTTNGEVLIHKDIEEYLTNYFGYTLFFIRTSKYNDGFIYFVGGRKGVSDTVGVFDLSKEKIVWHQKLDIPEGEFIGAGEDKIQFNNQNLYVLDTSHTLHIFDKESV